MYNHKLNMLKKFTTSDILMLIAAFITLLFGVGFVLSLNKYKGYK